MRNHYGIRSLRRAAVSRLFAAFIVILAVSPFTTPFLTFDLTELPGSTAVHHAAWTADKTTKEISAMGLIVSIVHLSPASIVLEAARLTVDTDRRPALPIVLRL